MQALAHVAGVLDGVGHLGGVDAEPLDGGVEDAPVGLVEHEVVDVGRGSTPVFSHISATSEQMLVTANLNTSRPRICEAVLLGAPSDGPKGLLPCMLGM